MQWQCHLDTLISSISAFIYPISAYPNHQFEALMASSLLILVALCVFLTCFMAIIAIARNLNQEIEIVWGNDRAEILNNGKLLSLSLDEQSGSGFQSRNQFLFGKIDVQIKLVHGNSAGTVTAYYLQSKEEMWDEIDIEFLGNLSGEPYILHTNVYTQGKGSREKQFYLWFDPTSDFHTHSILRNIHAIIFFVDGTPIREFKNMESMGISYPKSQPMRLYSSLWDADNWATRGGLIKTDWSQAPFTAFYRNLKTNACVWSSSSCSSINSSDDNPWLNEELDRISLEMMKWVQKNYMIYNYCNDERDFPKGCLLNVLSQMHHSEDEFGLHEFL